jgi:hypothetical protein
LPLALAPAWLIPPLPDAETLASVAPVRPCEGLSPYADAAIELACQAIRRAANGQQRVTLLKEAFTIGTLAGAGGIPQAFARAALIDAGYGMSNYDPHEPWTGKEIARVVDGAFIAGCRRPRPTLEPRARLRRRRRLGWNAARQAPARGSATGSTAPGRHDHRRENVAMRDAGMTLMAIRDTMRERGHRISHQTVANIVQRHQLVAEMSDLAQFTALATLIIGGFGLFAFMFQRLEARLDGRMDRFEAEIKELRRDMAEEFRAQRAEVAAQTSAIANAIIASRPA